jgi:excisionase family DNA binding protein
MGGIMPPFFFSAVLTPRDAARYLQCSRTTLGEAVRRREIPYRKLGRRLLFLKADLDAWLSRLPGVSVDEAVKVVQAKTVFVTHTVHLEDERPAWDTPQDDMMPLRRGHSRKGMLAKALEAPQATADTRIQMKRW